MEAKRLIRDVVQAARDLDARELWKRFTNFDCFAVRLLGQDEPLVASVMGAAGEQYGLMLFRGPRAAEGFRALTAAAGPADDAVEDLDMLSFNVEPFGEMDPLSQGFYRGAGLHPRFDEQVPGFLVKPPNRRPRMPDRAELGLLLAVLRGVVAADRAGELKPTRIDDPGGICFVTLTGDPSDPDVSVTREPAPVGPIPSQAHVFEASTMDVSGLRRLDATWLVGTPPVAVSFEDDDRSMQLLVVADDASGRVLQARPFFGGCIEEAIAALAEAFRGETPTAPGGIPARILFSNRKLCDAVAAALRGRRVKCVFAPSLPALEALSEEFLAALEEGVSVMEEVSPEGAAGAAPPAGDDLAGWKAADERLSRRFARVLSEDDRLWSSRPAGRYFGADEVEPFLREHGERSVVSAYATWGVVSYRPTRKSKTRAEQMLAEGLPEAEADLLRARMEAHPSIYRVIACDPDAGTVDLEDVLLGGPAVTVHDQLLSENVQPGLFLALSVFGAGRFRFADVAGPPLGPLKGGAAVDFLGRCGLEFTPEGLRRGAGLFGRLWTWSEQWGADGRSRQLLNADGGDLLFHTATFTAADPGAAAEALAGRKDVEYDEDNDEYVWLREGGGRVPMPGGPVVLGRIACTADGLTLQVNSAERFARARAWLTKLPGVTFRDVRTRGPEELMAEAATERDRPAGRAPSEVSPEMAAGMQEMLEGHYMRWLDMPLPALAGRTPRETCRTAAGREQVAAMIRTIPQPTGGAPVTVPRQAMLEALGLADGPPAAAAPPPAGPSPGAYEPAAADPAEPLVSEKVGRNQPCPCGSGKKYKKCCGR